MPQNPRSARIIAFGRNPASTGTLSSAAIPVYQHLMHRFASLAFVFLAVLLGGAGQAPPPRLIEFSAADRADLERVTTYLNSLRTLRGEFVQIGPNGEIDQGAFYLSKPGKLRFEYRPPSPLLIVSDGRTLAVSNSKLKTVDRYPLSSTPLDLILADKLDLNHDNSIMAVVRQPGTLVVEARTSRNRKKPNLAITFSEPELELRQWSIVDDQGLVTTVALRNLETGIGLNDTLFVLRDAKKPVGAKPRD
jgi:outer membrane lipoprotein-sorting protein